MSSESAHVNWGPVRGPPGTGWDKDKLIEHVKTGMSIELGTIPLYLCALYSIQQDGNEKATSARLHILSIVQQEMLHLSLAGNLLRALDGTRLLYAKTFVPTYPSKILFDKIDMKLQPANKDNLECFLRIEAPYMPTPVAPQSQANRAPRGDILVEYNSIGQFYDELVRGIREVSGDTPGDELFSHNHDKQFNGEEFFDSRMTVITNEETALQALETIIDQGEGNIGIPDSHYAIFVELYQQRKQWQTIDYIEEPQTSKYENDPIAYRLSLAVNASYCYLLQTNDSCWQVGDQLRRPLLLRNLQRLMVEILSPCANILVRQKLESGKYAAPCFEFYPPSSDNSLPPKVLFANLTAELQAARDAAVKAGDVDAEKGIEKILFRLQSMNVVS